MFICFSGCVKHVSNAEGWVRWYLEHKLILQSFNTLRGFLKESSIKNMLSKYAKENLVRKGKGKGEHCKLWIKIKYMFAVWVLLVPDFLDTL